VAVCKLTGQIATASKDGTVKIWHPQSKSSSKRLLRGDKKELRLSYARFASDGGTLVETWNRDYGNFVRHDLTRGSQKR
jgi:WD40 repeat protein